DDQAVGAAQLTAQVFQGIGFRYAIDNRSSDAASQFAFDHLQRVGEGVIQIQPLLEPLGEKGEAAGYQQRFRSVLSETIEHALGTRRQRESLFVDSLQR